MNNLISFKEFLIKFRESSPLTRSRMGSALGLYPPRADFMSRSTPPPGIMDKLQSDLNKTHKRKRKHKKKKKSS
jgi:hypothetical protein